MLSCSDQRGHEPVWEQCSRPAVTRQTFALWIVPPTWFPAYWSFLSAAEANFAKDAEDVSLTQRPRVFTGTWASLVSGDFVAVGLAGLALLSDQGAGDSRRHISERRTKPQRNKISAPAVRVWGWRPFSPKQVTCRLTGLGGTEPRWKIFSLMADRWLRTKTLEIHCVEQLMHNGHTYRLQKKNTRRILKIHKSEEPGSRFTFVRFTAQNLCALRC